MKLQHRFTRPRTSHLSAASSTSSAFASVKASSPEYMYTSTPWKPCADISWSSTSGCRLSLIVRVNMARKCGLPAARTTRCAGKRCPSTTTSTSVNSKFSHSDVSTLVRATW